MSTTTPLIDLDDGQTVAMTPPAALGAAFGAVIAEALDWSEEKRLAVDERLYPGLDADDEFTDAQDRVDETLFNDAGLGWSCAFGDDTTVVEAEPYTETLGDKVSAGAAQVATAVLARDLGLITEADFTTLTGWWATADLPLPPARDGAVFATDQDQVTANTAALTSWRLFLDGWPLAAPIGQERPEPTSKDVRAEGTKPTIMPCQPGATPEARVEAGAAVLDLVAPGWYTRRELDQLDMVQDNVTDILTLAFARGYGEWYDRCTQAQWEAWYSHRWGLGFTDDLAQSLPKGNADRERLEAMPWSEQCDTLLAWRNAECDVLTAAWRTAVETRRQASQR